jgi:nonsense-mediated mRNA decay protein 3
MFCVECGKEGPIFNDGVCINCYIKSHTFTQGPKIIDLPNCAHCGSFKYKSNWTSDLFGDVLRRIIRNTFDISKELTKVDINTECNEMKDGMSCDVYISGFLNDVEITEKHEVQVRLKRTVCDVCSKRFGGYHEAIVQIRADKKGLSKKEINDIKIIVENIITDLQTKGNRGLFITEIAEEHGGLDFYISERGPSLIIAKKIQELFGGEIKQSSKNVGMKDSKQIYKMTYLIRLPSFKKDDFIIKNNSFFKIISIHGNKVKLIKLDNWDETIGDSKAIQKAKILGGKELVQDMILVSQTEDELQIMDPETYKIYIIKKPKPIKMENEKLKILKTEKQLFLLPK